MMAEGARDPREGHLEEAGGRWRLKFERRLPHPPEKVWRALTEEEHLKAWFPTTIEGELRPGAPLRFRFRGEDVLPAAGEVTEYDPPRVFEFTWGLSEEDVSEPERTRLEVRPDGDGCVLTLTTTYDQVGKSARDAAGWHVCLDHLEAELAGVAPPAPPEGSGESENAWAPLKAKYSALFGPDASTIGPPEGYG